MAKVTDLVILNPADKTRMYSVAIGKGVPTDTDDPINTNVKDFPIGSQYTDLTGRKFYVRTDSKGSLQLLVSLPFYCLIRKTYDRLQKHKC